jgi:hypothetical protein
MESKVNKFTSGFNKITNKIIRVDEDLIKKKNEAKKYFFNYPPQTNLDKNNSKVQYISRLFDHSITVTDDHLIKLANAINIITFVKRNESNTCFNNEKPTDEQLQNYLNTTTGIGKNAAVHLVNACKHTNQKMKGLLHIRTKRTSGINELYEMIKSLSPTSNSNQIISSRVMNDFFSGRLQKYSDEYNSIEALIPKIQPVPIDVTNIPEQKIEINQEQTCIISDDDSEFHSLNSEVNEFDGFDELDEIPSSKFQDIKQPEEFINKEINYIKPQQKIEIKQPENNIINEINNLKTQLKALDLSNVTDKSAKIIKFNQIYADILELSLRLEFDKMTDDEKKSYAELLGELGVYHISFYPKKFAGVDLASDVQVRAAIMNKAYFNKNDQYSQQYVKYYLALVQNIFDPNRIKTYEANSDKPDFCIKEHATLYENLKSGLLHRLCTQNKYEGIDGLKSKLGIMEKGGLMFAQRKLDSSYNESIRILNKSTDQKLKDAFESFEKLD